MTAAEKRAKKLQWVFYNDLIELGVQKPMALIFKKSSVKFHEINCISRNGNKRLITYLNRTARAEHMKHHGKTPKPVKTIRQMYLDEKNKQ